MESHLPKPMIQGELARLFPVLKGNQLEDRASSILLATFNAVPEFCDYMLDGIKQHITKNTKLDCYSQVVLESPKESEDRPDGLMRVTRGKTTWTALIEAKIGKETLDREQLLKYFELTKQNGINAVITISNEFTHTPTIHPIQFKKNELKNAELYHWSWLDAVSQAILLLQQPEFNDPLKRHLLEEFLRYFEHKDVGVSGFTKMNSEWKEVIQKVHSGASLVKTDLDLRNTVAAWHQECKEIDLILSRQLNVPVSEKLSPKHKKDSEQRIKDDVAHLADTYELVSVQHIPDAAADLKIVANLSHKNIVCSMSLDAIMDKKRNIAQISWLTRQLQKAQKINNDMRLKAIQEESEIQLLSSDENLFIRGWHKGSKIQSQQSLKDLLDNPESLVLSGKEKTLFTKFEISLVIGLGNSFTGSEKFIRELEKIVPAFYAEIGQHLHAWSPPPPKVKSLSSSESSED